MNALTVPGEWLISSIAVIETIDLLKLLRGYHKGKEEGKWLVYFQVILSICSDQISTG